MLSFAFFLLVAALAASFTRSTAPADASNVGMVAFIVLHCRGGGGAYGDEEGIFDGAEAVSAHMLAIIKHQGCCGCGCEVRLARNVSSHMADMQRSRLKTTEPDGRQPSVDPVL